MRRARSIGSDFYGGGSIFATPGPLLQSQQRSHTFSSMDEVPPLVAAPSFWSNECDNPTEGITGATTPTTPNDMDDAYLPRRPQKRPRLKMEEAFRSMSLHGNDGMGQPLSSERSNVSVEKEEVNSMIEQNSCDTPGDNSAAAVIDEDFTDDSEPETKEDVTTAAKEAMYRLVFGRTQKKELNLVDAKIEGIIRKSRVEALKLLKETKDVTMTKDDLHLSPEKQEKTFSSKNRSKSFDDLENEIKL